jgi:PEP-CTERM motif
VRHLWKAALICTIVAGGAARAEAIPLLQLDMKGGVYDPATETIVAPGGSFELYAILTPQTNATAAEMAALLADTYYVSVGITPQLNTASSLGSFTFGQTGTTPTTVDVTADMTYGTPPLESFLSLQGFDPGDLAKHGVYPTYFSQFEVHFTAVNTTLAYNTANNPGGLTPSSTGTAYYVSFKGDSSLLAAGYNLHFDLYSTEVLNCGKKGFPLCKDVDINKFAPFSHDAETTERVPEPSSALFAALGLAAAGIARFRRA